MHAPPSSGKTIGGREYLQGYLSAFEGVDTTLGKAHGIMFTGTGYDMDYFDYMSARLGAGEFRQWIYALVAALSPDPTSPRCFPSILILDDFNEPGNNDMNVAFIKKLMKTVTDRGFYTLILTQNPVFGTYLCSLNGGQKIQPLPGTFTGEKTNPVWNDFAWSRQELTKLVDKQHGNAFDGEKDADGCYSWIELGETPMDVKGKADVRLAPRGSPKKARLRYS
jgi:hypothetical protein